MSAFVDVARHVVVTLLTFVLPRDGPETPVLTVMSLTLGLSHDVDAVSTIGCPFIALRIAVDYLLRTIKQTILRPLFATTGLPGHCTADVAKLCAAQTSVGLQVSISRWKPLAMALT